MITIVIAGKPAAKGRPRVTKSGHAFTPAKTKTYETSIKMYAAEAMKGQPPIDGAVRVSVFVMLPVPKSFSKKRRIAALSDEIMPTTKPDIDNYLKAALDGINSIVIRDDSQVVRAEVYKIYSERPRMEITVREI